MINKRTDLQTPAEFVMFFFRGTGVFDVFIMFRKQLFQYCHRKLSFF